MRRRRLTAIYPALFMLTACTSAAPTRAPETTAANGGKSEPSQRCARLRDGGAARSRRTDSTSDGERAESPAQREEPRVHSGDPLPADAGEPPAEGEVRWLASDPHVPFVRVDTDGVHSYGEDACRRWAVVGSRWHEVDAYGRIVGEAELTGGQGYDATQCYELSMSRTSGREGVGVLASAAYRPPSDVAEWNPDRKARRTFAQLVAKVDALFPHFRGRGSLPGVDERTLYYERPEDDRLSDYPKHWAVAGGRALVVASYEQDGHWRIRHMENRYSVQVHGPVMAYRPLAVIDLDGSGQPEILFHEDAGAGWNDVLLESGGMIYRRVAESVGGATV